MPRPHFAHERGRTLTRGVAMFLAGFTLLNILGEAVSRHFDGNFWWIDLHPLPATLARLVLLTTAVLLLVYAVRPVGALWRRRVTASCAGLLAVFAAWNSIEFFALLIRGGIHSSFPVPLSLFVLAALLAIARDAARGSRRGTAAPGDVDAAETVTARRPGFSTGSENPGRRGCTPTEDAKLPAPLCPGVKGAGSTTRHRLQVAAVAALCCIGFTLAQMLCFGHTDYRRPADAIVVFGARTYADGSASQALADRVRTACELYHEGYARTLVFSGGPGDGPVHETQAMRLIALRSGVPDSAIFCDDQGLNTDATVRNTGQLFARLGVHRVLAVSHAYHLPRVKMAYRRLGWDVYTVPARETRTLRQMPFLTAREVAALWAYYLRPIMHPDT